MPTPEDDAVPADDAAPVPDVVEPIGAHEAPPEVGAVRTWDWRSGPAFGAAPGSEGTRTAWEPTPFASFGAAPSIEPIQPALLVSPDDGIAAELLATPDAPEPAPAAQPLVALAGAVAPDGQPRTPAASSSSVAPRREPSTAADDRAPGTIVAARIMLWITAIGAILTAVFEVVILVPYLLGEGLTIPWGYLLGRIVPGALLLCSSVATLWLVRRRLGAAWLLALAGAVLGLVTVNLLTIVLVPSAVLAAVLLVVPASRRWLSPAR